VQLVPSIPFEQVDQLTPSTYTIEIASMLAEYLEKLEQYYNNEFQRIDKIKDIKVNYLMQTNKVLYNAKKQAFHNESISDLATKALEKNKVLEYNDELVQQYDPVFRDPEPESFISFRSHFLAPRKYFFGQYWDTFWFNMSIVWSMTIVLYFTLYFELLKKALTLLSNINLKKFRFSKK